MLRGLSLLICAALLSPFAGAETNLNGAGATFPNPIYSKWFSDYHKQHPDIAINYQSIGSGGGIQQLKAGTVDFGASDMPLKPEQLQQLRGPIIQFPTVLGSVVPAYNLPEVQQEIKFTPEALAGIYLGKVTRWNDKLLAEANPGVKLPAKDIIVCHRSDGSGTTFVWTDYLSKVSPEWKANVGSNTSVNWPVGLGGKGNEGVSGLVRQQPGAIGYVELIYALQNKITFGSVENASGKFVKASLPSTTAAASGVNMPDDFVVSITNSPGKDAYPIASFTYLLIPTKWPDAQKRQAITAFLTWMLDHGQSASSSLDYAPIPKSVSEKERARIKEIQ
jgi:phosphate transport system substrate-binding protein